MLVTSKVKSNNYEQIFFDSGCTYSENDILEFEINCKNSISELNGFTFNLKVIFGKKEKEAASFEAKVLEDNKTIELSLFNFTNSLPVGNVVPMNIGNLNKRPLFLRFLVTNLNSAGYKFDYYLYLGSEENAEQN